MTAEQPLLRSARSAPWLAVAAVLALVAGMLGFSAPAPAAAAITTGIAGVVQDPEGDNLPNVAVVPYLHVGNFWHQMPTVYTDTNGAYELSLSAGEYRVHYIVNNYTHASEFWNNATSFDASTSINVTNGSVFTANVGVLLGGTISGHVGGDTAGNHLAGAMVTVYRYMPLQYWQIAGAVVTNASGNYTYAGLATGNYRVLFQSAAGQNYIQEFYVDAINADSAQDVAVIVGQNTPSIDAVLTGGGTVSGQVLGDTGSGTVPLAGVNVQAIKDGGNGPFFPPVTTNASGNYTLSGLPAGDYVIAFHPQDGAYLYEYWNDHRIFTDADFVNVTVGGTDTANATLTRAAQINGVVTGPDGAPLENLTVYAWDAAGNSGGTASGDQTDSLGQYSLGGLPAGDYVIQYRTPAGSPLVQEWWNDAPQRADADAVTVTIGQVVNNVNAQLATGATVSGTVQGQGAGDLAGVTVGAYRYDESQGQWTLFTSAQTDASGDYQLVGLEAGDWAIRFSHFVGGWAQQYWQGASGVDDATLLTLALGQNQTAINATLQQGATFSGTVTGQTNASPVPLAAYVAAERQGADDTWETITSVAANASGQYSLIGLPPGTYRFIYGFNADYASVYWGGGYFDDEAELVELSGTEVDSGNNIQLALGVSIEGTIFAENEQQVFDVWARIYMERSEGVWESPSLGGGHGDNTFYHAGALPAGTYTVSFTDQSDAADPYVTQWWNNQPTLETATEIVAEPGDDITGISAVMTKTPWEFTTAPVPTITGTAQAGAELTAVPGTWAPAPVELTYQWFVGGVARSGAVNATFTPEPGDAGAVVTVAVTGTKDDFTQATRTSQGTSPLLTVFSDVPNGHAFGTEINWMFTSAISRGYLDGGVRSYHTEEAVSRQAMAAFLYRLAGSPAFTPPATPSFTDVPANHGFFKEIEWMKAEAITTGNADGTYAPEAPVSREAMAAFLYRYSDNPSYTPPATATFADVPTNHFFFKQIEWMKTEGITNGYPDGYHPGEAVSRQAMAAFLYRLSH